MAKKRAVPAGGRRKRRTPEEMIADLEEEIRRVKARAEAKALKTSPVARAALSAVKALDKGLAESIQEGEEDLRGALQEARRAIAAVLDRRGLKLPKAGPA